MSETNPDSTRSHEFNSGAKPEAKSEASPRAVSQAILLFCTCVALLFCLGIPSQAFSVSIGLPITLLLCVLAPAILFARIKKLPVMKALRVNLVSPWVMLSSVLVGIGGWCLAYGAYRAMEVLFGPPIDSGMGEPGSNSEYLGLLLVGALLPGICEEVLFRGAIQGVLEKRGSIFGVVTAAILFGLFHLDPWRIIPAALLGVFFGLLVLRTNSIVPAIIAHISNNALAFSVSYFLEDDAKLESVLLPVLAVVLVVGVVLFAMATRNLKGSKEHPLKSSPCGLPTPMVWLLGMGLSGLVGLLTLFAWVMVAVIAMVPMDDDSLLPHIKKGDQLLLIKQGCFAFDAKGGDTIAFRRGEETLSRVVIEVDQEHITVQDGDGVVQVPNEDVIGKMIIVIPSASPE